MTLRRISLSLSIALLGFAILEAAAISLELIPKLNQESQALPSSLADIELISSVNDTEAIHEISRLHGKDLPVDSANIGSYGSNHDITVWVAGTSFVSDAQGMIRDMEESISEGTTPFTPKGVHEQEGRLIYELSGMGQSHFYFRSNRNVVWLAASPQLAKEALDQLLAYYP